MEPTLAMSFDDLMIRTAEFMGIAYYGASGTSAAATPTDTHDLDMVKRIVNDGWRKFCGSFPRGWNWMSPTFRLQFDPDGTSGRTVNDGNDSIPRASRYYMPDGFFGHFLTGFTYDSDGPRLEIENTEEHHIRQLFAAAGSTTGDPYLCAVRPLATGVGSYPAGGRWEAIFFPTPQDDQYVTARLRLMPNKLVNTTDRHAAGFQFDEAVLAACLAEAEQQRDKSAGVMTAKFAEALSRAIIVDQGSVPRNLGYNGDGSNEGGRKRHAWFSGVDSYVNMDGTTHSF